jgi:epoxyqueuosine reductase
MSLSLIEQAVAPHGLMIMGHDTSRVLIGTDANWWDAFIASPEYSDHAKDPVDRWSKRIIGALATDLGATAAFPSDGPPYAPCMGAWHGPVLAKPDGNDDPRHGGVDDFHSWGADTANAAA